MNFIYYSVSILIAGLSLYCHFEMNSDVLWDLQKLFILVSPIALFELEITSDVMFACYFTETLLQLSLTLVSSMNFIHYISILNAGVKSVLPF